MPAAPNLVYSVSTDQRRLNLPWLYAQLKASYWGDGYTDTKINAAVRASLCLGVYEDEILDGGEIVTSGRQVGFARVVGDGVLFSSLMDVIVQEDRRGRGLGRMLLAEVVGHPDVAQTLCILQTRSAAQLYVDHGFSIRAAVPGDGFLMVREGVR